MKTTHFPLAVVFATMAFAFSASLGAAPVKYSGKTYKTVEIGTQTWIAENLNYEAEGSKCYDNKPENCTKYGRLYDWETAMRVCPKGWHLPSDEEWDVLVDYVGGFSTAGTKLRTTNGWYGDINGTDDYGFSALPGGIGYSNGYFNDIGNSGRWWSSSEGSSNGTYSRYIGYNIDYAIWVNYDTSYLFSVRCIQD